MGCYHLRGVARDYFPFLPGSFVLRSNQQTDVKIMGSTWNFVLERLYRICTYFVMISSGEFIGAALYSLRRLQSLYCNIFSKYVQDRTNASKSTALLFGNGDWHFS